MACSCINERIRLRGLLEWYREAEWAGCGYFGGGVYMRAVQALCGNLRVRILFTCAFFRNDGDSDSEVGGQERSLMMQN
jgi:hypothetical protein